MHGQQNVKKTITSCYTLNEKIILQKWEFEKQTCMKFHKAKSSSLLYERVFQARGDILN